MNYITTFSKILFDPINPKTEDILIEDIAHSLSMLCRANGHFPTFYSVAQHSLNCMNEAKARGYSTKIQFACLLHDGSEAYISDVIRPVKCHLPQYLPIEKNLQNKIWGKWLSSELTEEEYRLVFEIDDAIMYHEFVNISQRYVSEIEPEILSKPVFEFTSFKDTEEQMLKAFYSFEAGAEYAG